MSHLSGSFLLAKPVIRDAHFKQSVVLLVQHGPEGAFGLVVNRPAEVSGLPFPVFAGGPCQAPGLLMLHGHADWVRPEAEAPQSQVLPGVFLGDSSCVNRVSEAGEGEALLEKGAVEKARRNLAQLESMCGGDCEETRELAAALARGPQPTVLTAEAVTPDTVVTQN